MLFISSVTRNKITRDILSFVGSKDEKHPPLDCSKDEKHPPLDCSKGEKHRPLIAAKASNIRPLIAAKASSIRPHVILTEAKRSGEIKAKPHF